MYSQFYAENPLLFWPLVGLAIFVIAFVAVLVYVLIALRDPRKVDHLARLPLEPEADRSSERHEIRVAEKEA